ncbi:MAG: hypothetical protein IKH30_14020 [Clostridia bacterium]|nr:hypothetical protein [Clostridia bacterium]
MAIIYFLLYMLCGTAITFSLLPKKSPVVRIWLGLCLGLILMMWLPALCAFFLDFSLTAHALAMAPLLLLTLGAVLLRSREPWAKITDRDRRLLKALLFVALPLTLVGGYLQWTHNLNPVDGAMHVGQSTYGDLCLHLAIASSLRDASFPPDYSILPGALLAYPFLTDSLSTSFMLLGFSLRWAILFPGILMTGLTFAGYLILADRMADSRRAAMLAALFFFLNGGLGFFYLVDMKGEILGSYENNELQAVRGLWNRIQSVLNGWYQTPANHREFSTYNLRWSNVIVDMMVPQRTTLGGWCQVIPCIYLLYDALLPENTDSAERAVPWRQLILAGLWAGMLPMVNTHCFLALGLMCFGWLVWDLIHSRGQRGKALLFWCVFGGLAVALAAPQLFTWTFSQAVGNSNFLKIHFNWVNNNYYGLRDGYRWFYIKNIGLPFILILLALLEKNRKRRFIAAGAFVIFLAAEFIQFQPNEYDNNKLFYIWYMLCAVIAADYGFELLDKLKGMRARPVVAVLCCILFFSTGVLAVAREANSDYEIFSAADVAAAEYVENNTDQHAMFMTGDQHRNFVSSLAGRRIVCGPDLWLSFHGYDNSERHADVKAFYADPVGHLDILEKYGVEYILVGDWERGGMTVNEQALRRLFPVVYQSEYQNVVIFEAKLQEASQW